MAHESFEDEATARGDERAVRQHQGRPRGAARHRPDLHVGAASSRRAGRLAADDVSHARRASRSGAAPISRKASRYGRPAFVDVLREVARLFREEPDKIEQNRDALMARLAERARPAGAGRDRRGRARPARARRSAAPSTRSTAACAARRNFRNAALFEIAAGAPGCGTGERRGYLRRLVEHHARAHLRGRHLRPSRRRLLALLGRRALAGAAFREDALRQRAASRPAGARLPSSARGNARCFRAARARDRRLARARDDHRGGGLLPPRSTPIPKARRASSTSGRADEIMPRARPEDGCILRAALRRERGRQFRGPQHPQSARRASRAARRTSRGSRMLRAKLLAVRRQARAAGPRRQGAGRLERPDDRGAGQCRRHAGRAGLDRDGDAAPSTSLRAT